MGLLSSDPWENAWIIIGLIVGSIFSISIVLLAGVGLSRSGLIGWMLSSFEQILLYVPNAVLFFGFMSDIVNQEVNRSIASISGLVGVSLTFLIGKLVPVVKSYVYTPPASMTATALPGGPLTSEAPDTNPFRGGGNPLLCSIPGLSLLETDLAPQNLLLTTAILFYYMLSEWVSNPTQSIGVSITSAIIILSQIVSLFMNDCLGKFRFSETSKAIPIILALVLGIGYGGITYAMWEKVIVPRLGSGSTSVGGSLKSTEPVGSLSKDSQEVKIGSPGEQVSADLEDGDYELVGELFKDGELITSSIVD